MISIIMFMFVYYWISQRRTLVCIEWLFLSESVFTTTGKMTLGNGQKTVVSSKKTVAWRLDNELTTDLQSLH